MPRGQGPGCPGLPFSRAEPGCSSLKPQELWRGEDAGGMGAGGQPGGGRGCWLPSCWPWLSSWGVGIRLQPSGPCRVTAMELVHPSLITGGGRRDGLRAGTFQGSSLSCPILIPPSLPLLGSLPRSTCSGRGAPRPDPSGESTPPPPGHRVQVRDGNATHSDQWPSTWTSA